MVVHEIDRLDLKLSEGEFTYSILNFSNSNMIDPLKCLQGICRTLKPDSIVAILTWRRFGVGEIIHVAQRFVPQEVHARRCARRYDCECWL